jgi:hypothetical protein
MRNEWKWAIGGAIALAAVGAIALTRGGSSPCGMLEGPYAKYQLGPWTGSRTGPQTWLCSAGTRGWTETVVVHLNEDGSITYRGE